MFFFFQAEDGIRDIGVTGVQTCALPILRSSRGPRGRGSDRLPLVWPKRDDASLCARRPAGEGADAREPGLLRLTPERLQRRSVGAANAGADPRARRRTGGARRAGKRTVG